MRSDSVARRKSVAPDTRALLAGFVLFLGTGTNAAAQEAASAEAMAQANNPLASSYAFKFKNF